MRPDPEEEWARWVDWLGEGPAPSIWDDVVAMMASRQVWEAFQIVYKSAPEEVRTRRNPTFYSWITDGYTRRQGLAIRRQVDMDRDVISLAGLIDRVRRYPDVLSRERFAARSVLERPEADRVFDAIVGEGRDHIDPNVPRADLATLKTTTRKVVTWVDNEVAHYNEAKGRFAQGLTFGDIHGSVDLMVDLSSKFRELIRGDSMVKSVSGMDFWWDIFDKPWIESQQQMEGIVRKVEDIDSRRMAGERVTDAW